MSGRRAIRLLFIGNPESSFQRDLYNYLRKRFQVVLVSVSKLRKNPFSLLRELITILRYRHKVDAIFVEFLAYRAWLVGVLKLLGLIKVPVVVRCHRFEVYELFSKFPWIVKSAADRADVIICVSYRVRDDLLSKYSRPQNKIVVVYNGVDVERFKRKKPYKKRKPFVLGSLGRLTNQKGFTELVVVVAKLIQHGYDIVLKIGGRGPLMPILRKLVKMMNAEQRIFVEGFIPDDKLVDWYNDLNLLVINSRSEGHPVVSVEALACGVPIIATNVDDLRTILGDEYIYDFGDWKQLIKLVDRMYNATEEELLRISEANRKKALDFFDKEKQFLKIAKIIMHTAERVQSRRL